MTNYTIKFEVRTIEIIIFFIRKRSSKNFMSPYDFTPISYFNLLSLNDFRYNMGDKMQKLHNKNTQIDIFINIVTFKCTLASIFF